MSADDVLTEDDKALLDHMDQQIDDAESPSEYQEAFEELRAEFRKHRAEFRRFQRDVEQRLSQLEEAGVSTDEEDVVPLTTWQQLDEDDREAELSTSELIALTLHENWADIAWTLGGASNYAGSKAETRSGVDTKTRANAKYNPSRLKHRLKKELDFDPAHNQMYRGLKRLADGSGGEEVVDGPTGRVHVIGGQYEYREMATADGKDVKRVLWRSTDD